MSRRRLTAAEKRALTPIVEATMQRLDPTISALCREIEVGASGAGDLAEPMFYEVLNEIGREVYEWAERQGVVT